MNTLLIDPPVVNHDAVVASYLNHAGAETAVRRLVDEGIAANSISIIGRNFETREDIQGFYRPADAALEGAGQGAWYGSFFGLILGAMGIFVVPMVGALMVLGPLSGLIAGAIGGAGVGAVVSALTAFGIPRDQAIKYQERLQAGEFLIVVHASTEETKAAHEMLKGTGQVSLQAHGNSSIDTQGHSIGNSRM